MMRNHGWIVASLLLSLTNFVYALPTNNDRVNATVIGALPYQTSQNTKDANRVVEEMKPSCAGTESTVWYQYKPSNDQNIRIDTFGSNYDTVVSVWTDESEQLTEIICKDDSHDTLQSQAAVHVKANTIYYVNISGLGESAGDLVLAMDILPDLQNDNLAQAITIDEIPGTFQQSTVGATNETNAASPSCASTGADVWFKYTADTNRIVVFNTFDSDFNTVLSAWTGNDHPLTEIDCNNDGTIESAQSQISLPVSTGQTYYINVAGIRTEGALFPESGFVTLNTALPAIHDDLVNAIEIDSLPFNATHSAAGATLEASEVGPSCGGVTSASVWYKYTPSEDGSVSFDTLGADYDTVLSVWTGSNHPLTEVGCNDMAIHKEDFNQSQIAVPLTANTPYYINVSTNFSATPGTVTLNVKPTVNDLQIVSQPHNVTINRGEPVTLKIEASGETPILYQWYQGSVGNTSTQVGTNSSELVLTSLTNTTIYWVKMTNATGERISDVVTVTVNQVANGKKLSMDGSEMTSGAHFAGLISGGNQLANTLSFTQEKAARVVMNVYPASEHVGSTVNIVMFAEYNGTRYMRQGGKWVNWDGNLATLAIAKSNVTLSDAQEVLLFSGYLTELSLGNVKAYVGYQLDNGDIIYGKEAPVDLTILPSVR